MRRVLLDGALKTVAMALGVAAAMWMMREVPPVEMTSMRLVGSWVKNVPGGEFTIRNEGMKNRLCPVTIREELIDSHGDSHVLPLRPGVVDSVGEFISDVKYRLPPEPLPDGLTTFHSRAIYQTDYLNGCFKVWTIAAPQRPDVRFWVGEGPPPWSRR